MASGGTNIQSVMTVFRPQQSNEAFGMRFWSSQVFRYAGYKNKDNGETLGDPANAEFTEYLIKSKLWSPPSVRTAFDLLPLVLKMPQIDKPFIYNIPHDLAHELDIEHPQFPAVKDLHLKWAAIPAITNFKMNLGGLIYPCMPFNGWFLSTEIARNLLERYSMTIPLAKAMNIPFNDRMLVQKVTAEFENAILHSFEKQEYTIVDPMTVGKSFMTHCQRERKAGRECPGQWSWIGGLVGELLIHLLILTSVTLC
jgi:nitric oxide synthase oxygenase domain/subunit